MRWSYSRSSRDWRSRWGESVTDGASASTAVITDVSRGSRADAIASIAGVHLWAIGGNGAIGGSSPEVTKCQLVMRVHRVAVPGSHGGGVGRGGIGCAGRR